MPQPYTLEKDKEPRAANLLLKATEYSRGWTQTLGLLSVVSKEESGFAWWLWFLLHTHPGGQWLFHPYLCHPARWPMVSQGGPHLHGGDMQVCLIDTMRACMSVVNTASGAQHWTNCGYSCSNGEGNGYPLQYSWLGNPMERGAWWAMVHRVAKSRTRLKQLSMHAHMHSYSN